VGRIRVLHVIEQLRRGGPLQALISAKKHSDRKHGIEHHIASIRPADRDASGQAATAGISGISAPSPESLRELIADSDIVQVHFWNSPDIHTFLRGDLPPMRLLLWCHVNGQPPHIIPESLLTLSDLVVVTARATLDRLTFKVPPPDRVSLVQSVADFTRVVDCRAVAHDGFHVGYVGRVDFAKIHGLFVSMCAAVSVPSARFFICGDGGATDDLKRHASELGVLDRFEFYNYIDDIRSFLAALDVFGYPLTAENYSTAELSLQEAMYAGIPPVVFSHGGPGEIVTNGRTGIVVDSREEYSAAIEWLYRHPEERRRLGEHAAREMREREQFYGSQPDLIYQRAMEQPKRLRTRMDVPRINQSKAWGRTGAETFVQSLDGHSDTDFIASLSMACDAEAEAAEQRIGTASAVWQDVILQYRVRNPNDPYLRLWAGLIFRAKGRPAVAAAEFRASIVLGCDAPRVHRYYAEGMTTARPKPPTAE